MQNFINIFSEVLRHAFSSWFLATFADSSQLEVKIHALKMQNAKEIMYYGSHTVAK